MDPVPLKLRSSTLEDTVSACQRIHDTQGKSICQQGSTLLKGSAHQVLPSGVRPSRPSALTATSRSSMSAPSPVATPWPPLGALDGPRALSTRATKKPATCESEQQEKVGFVRARTDKIDRVHVAQMQFWRASPAALSPWPRECSLVASALLTCTRLPMAATCCLWSMSRVM